MDSVDVDAADIVVDPTSRLGLVGPGSAPADAAETRAAEDAEATAEPPVSGPVTAPRIPRQVDTRSASPPGPATEAEPEAGAELPERARQMLAFERQWWRHAGAKEQAIRDQFGVSSTRYYQMLNGLLDDPAAAAFDPVLVARLRRLRATRTRTRRRPG
jgi:hypothetical protein